MQYDSRTATNRKYYLLRFLGSSVTSQELTIRDPFTSITSPRPRCSVGMHRSCTSLAGEPARLRYNGNRPCCRRGCLYDGAFGTREFPAAIAVAFCASRGLRLQKKKRLGDRRAIAADWLLHITWDVLHDVWEPLMVRWIPTSSMECAVTDNPVGTVDAAWYLRDL